MAITTTRLPNPFLENNTYSYPEFEEKKEDEYLDRALLEARRIPFFNARVNEKTTKEQFAEICRECFVHENHPELAAYILPEVYKLLSIQSLLLYPTTYAEMSANVDDNILGNIRSDPRFVEHNVTIVPTSQGFQVMDYAKTYRAFSPRETFYPDTNDSVCWEASATVVYRFNPNKPPESKLLDQWIRYGNLEIANKDPNIMQLKAIKARDMAVSDRFSFAAFDAFGLGACALIITMGLFAVGAPLAILIAASVIVGGLIIGGVVCNVIANNKSNRAEINYQRNLAALSLENKEIRETTLQVAQGLEMPLEKEFNKVPQKNVRFNETIEVKEFKKNEPPEEVSEQKSYFTPQKKL